MRRVVDAKDGQALKITRIILLLLILTFPLMGQGTRHFLFLSDQRVVTVELIDRQKAILNYINLSDRFEVIQAPLLVIRDVQDRPYRGHLIEVEDPPDPDHRYKVSDTLSPGQFQGYSILGDYHFQFPPQKAYFKVGSVLLELEPLAEEDFEMVAEKIERIDLSREISAKQVQLAGFHRGYGTLRRVGGEGAEQWEQYFPDLERLAPVVMTRPLPRLPPTAIDLPDPVIVRVSALITRSGSAREVQVTEGLNPALDKIAMEMVMDRWTFLPAIFRSDVAESRLTLRVPFERR